MSDQHTELTRVKSKISKSIMAFFKKKGVGHEFHADDLRRYVESFTGRTAPGSADRILRELRQQMALNYEVTNRRQSLYLITPVVISTQTQGELF